MNKEMVLLIAWLFGRVPRVITYDEMIALCKAIPDRNKPDWVRLLEGTRSSSFMTSARELALVDFDYEVKLARCEVFGDEF